MSSESARGRPCIDDTEAVINMCARWVQREKKISYRKLAKCQIFIARHGGKISSDRMTLSGEEAARLDRLRKKFSGLKKEGRAEAIGAAEEARPTQFRIRRENPNLSDMQIQEATAQYIARLIGKDPTTASTLIEKGNEAIQALRSAS